MSKGKWFVVSLDEGGDIALYGPYKKYERAANEAEDIFLADISGNTVTTVTTAIGKFEY